MIVSSGLNTDDKISDLRNELNIRHFPVKPFPIKSLLKFIGGWLKD